MDTPNTTLRFSDNAKFEKALRHLAQKHQCTGEIDELAALKLIVDYIQEHRFFLFFYYGEWEIKDHEYTQIAHGVTFHYLWKHICHLEINGEEDDDDS